MADSSKTNLLALVKQLEEQVNVITTYLEAEKLPEPSFIPSGDPLKPSMSSLPPAIEEARKKAYSLSWGLNTLLSTPDNHLVSTIFQFFDTVALRFVMEKKIGSFIPLSSVGVPASEISEKIGLPENRLVLILRQLAGVGIFREHPPQVFAHTTTSAFLQENIAIWQDFLLHTSDETFKSARYLPESFDLYANQFDKVQKPDLRTAFNLAFRTDAHFFDWLYFPENIARYGDRFGRAMMGMSRGTMGDLLDHYNWTQFEPGDKIVDVGGGVGHVGAWVKSKVKPGVEVIIQDIHSVVEQGRAIPGHNEILEFQAHDFLTEQPVIGAKLYYLRYIIHDWPDRICQTILQFLANAMNAESKILMFDGIWPDGEHWASGKDDKSIIEGYRWDKRFGGCLNMQMSNILGAKERTEKEWTELLKSVGLRINAVYARGRMHSIIEAVKD